MLNLLKELGEKKVRRMPFFSLFSHPPVIALIIILTQTHTHTLLSLIITTFLRLVPINAKFKK